MREVHFIDTSALFALVNAKDPDHEKVDRFVKRFQGKLVITNYIFDEIVTLALSRLGHESAVTIGNLLQKSPHIDEVWVTPSDEKQAWSLFASRTDKFYSFTDCTSFTVMRRLKLRRCLSLDRHFKQEGFEELL